MRPRTAVLGTGEVAWDAAVVSADDLGLGRGDGCFETLRVLGGTPPRLLHLAAHLDRFERSARALDLPAPDRAAWTALAEEICTDLGEGQEAALRLLLTRGTAGAGPTGLATLRPVAAEIVGQRATGVAVVTLDRGTAVDAHRAAPWLLGGVKTLSYAVNTAALREAARRGAQDVLFTTPAGEVLEGPTATALWFADGGFRTVPAGATGILAGTTQRAVFAGARAAGHPADERVATVPDLHRADALWLVSSVRGAVEVTSLDGRALPRRPDLTPSVRAWCEG
ncbi:hypothetical protein GTR02_05215 [Kineococcus sp. R8]|nr:hypothetical protein [Kineococcus siccus]